MKYYIATKFSNTKGFHDLKTLLDSKGHTCTHDWTKEDADKVAEAERDRYLQECAADDYNAVIRADFLILLAVPDMGGALVEFGIALGAGVPIVILNANGEGVRRNIFYSLPQCGRVQHVNGTDALLAIIGAQKGKDAYDMLGLEDQQGNVIKVKEFDPSLN